MFTWIVIGLAAAAVYGYFHPESIPGRIIRLGQVKGDNTLREAEKREAFALSDRAIKEARDRVDQLTRRVGELDGRVSTHERQVDNLVNRKAALETRRDKVVAAHEADPTDARKKSVALKTIRRLRQVEADLVAANQSLADAREAYETVFGELKNLDGQVDAAASGHESDELRFEAATLRRDAGILRRTLSGEADEAASSLGEAAERRRRLLDETEGHIRTARRLEDEEMLEREIDEQTEADEDEAELQRLLSAGSTEASGTAQAS